MLANWAGAIVFSIVTIYLLLLHAKRSSVMSKHPLNTPQHDAYVRLLKPSSLVISIVFLAFFGLRLALSSPSSNGQPALNPHDLPVYIFLAVVTVVIFVTTLLKYRKR